MPQSVSVAAAIRRVPVSILMCRARQERRFLAPCFSIGHSPGPHSFSPVLSTSRCGGPLVARGWQGNRFRLTGRLVGLVFRDNPGRGLRVFVGP